MRRDCNAITLTSLEFDPSGQKAPKHPPCKPPHTAPAGHSWALLGASPGVFYYGQWINMDIKTLNKWVDQHRVLKQLNGYEPPVLVNHDADADNGQTKGYVTRMCVVPGSKRSDRNHYLLALVRWNDPSTTLLIEQRKYRWVSPGIGPYVDDQGRAYKSHINEVSLTPLPYQRRLGDSHFLSQTHTRFGMEEEDKDQAVDENEGQEDQDSTPDIPAIMAVLTAMGARMEQLESTCAALMEQVDQLKPKAEGEEDQAQVAQMSAIFGALSEGLIWSKPETRNGIFKLFQKDSAAAMNIIREMRQNQGDALKTGSFAHLAQRLGVSGNPSVPLQSPKKTKAQIHAECVAEAKGDFSKAHALYISRTKEAK